MYCNNCGKEILTGDKFCPYCGTQIVSVVKRKITLDQNVTPDSIRKRAFILLEDGAFSEAEEYFDALMDMEPENAKAYLGKFLASKEFHSPKEMIEHYKDLYSADEWETEVAKLTDGQEEHILQMAQDHVLKGYLSEEKILSLYRQYDETYRSLYSCRARQKEKIEAEFTSNTLISRIRSFEDPECRKYFDEILKEYDKRLKDAKKEDKKKQVFMDSEILHH